MEAKLRPSKSDKAVDHRTRVGQERSARTRARIIEAALLVFADKGPDAPVIDDFIVAAGVARGTFYNYYKSTAELLEATSKWLEDDMMVSIETEIGELTDPVERLTSGVLMWLHKAASDPPWCAFVVRVRPLGQLVEESLARDLRDGLRSGVFTVPNVRVGRDLVVGTVREAVGRIADERVPRAYARDVLRVVLQGLGLDRQLIEQALNRPLPKMRRPARAVG